MTPKFFPYYYKDSENFYAPFVYYHGELENVLRHTCQDVGWDTVVCNVNPFGIPNGVYDGLHFGREVLVYIWSINGSRKRGLIVYADDDDAVHYARECMNTHESNP